MDQKLEKTALNIFTVPASTIKLLANIIPLTVGVGVGAAPFLGYMGGRKAYRYAESPDDYDRRMIQDHDNILLYNRLASKVESRTRRRLSEEGMKLEDLLNRDVV